MNNGTLFIYFVVCPHGTYGLNCLGQCQCQNGANCMPTTGDCICIPGYYGDKCELECDNGTYGVECAEVCQCENAERCRKNDGFCYCLPGYMGTFCSEGT